MKIAIASDDQQTIANHFGRTRGFLIYETENGEIQNQEYRINNFTGHALGLNHHNHDHHADRHSAILTALKDCQAVISRGMGRRIYEDLQNAGIETFIVDETNTSVAIQKYLENELQDNPEKGCDH
ncbi:MAG: iron-molybdenum cofactor biosynthesis protein [Calditrichaeota bacterium]|nr:iron-molybdenum cofactor biosynthesis protein [Calditrichota bacterium]